MAWSDEETLKLIEVWGDETIQAQLEGCKRNKDVYQKISREMAAAQYERTAEQCREKAKKLKAEYRKIKDRHNVTGKGRSKWRFFDAMDEVFGHKHSTQPPVVLDTSDEAPMEPPLTVSDADSDDEAGTSSNTTPTADKLGTSTDSEPHVIPPGAPKKHTDKQGSLTESEAHLRKKPMKKEKKKRPREGETVMSLLIDKLVEAQDASDIRQMELEEKRMKFEERVMEREEQRRREERHFQMQMMSMMMGRAPAHVVPRPPPATTFSPPGLHMENPQIHHQPPYHYYAGPDPLPQLSQQFEDEADC